jgi:hypothetical protein
MVERIAEKEVMPKLGCGGGYITAGERLRIYFRLLVREDMDSVFLQYRRETAMWTRTSSFRL